MPHEIGDVTVTQSLDSPISTGDVPGSPALQNGAVEADVIAFLDEAAAALHSKATRVLSFLVVLGLSQLAAIMWLAASSGIDAELQMLLTAVAAGTAGSCVASAVSVAERRAQGYEIPYQGEITVWASADRKDEVGRFSLAMLPFFYLRPFLGAFAGLLAFGGLSTGLLFGTVGEVDAPAVNLFLGLLSGLFAKSLFDSLRAAFKGLVGQ